MESISQYLKDLEVATAINEVCESPDGPLSITVYNYANPFELAGKRFISSVIVRYADTDEALYHVAFYQKTIGIQEANKAIEKIIADPTAYKNQ